MAIQYTNRVAKHIAQLRPSLDIEIVRVPTRADRYYYPTPPDIGGKSEFLEEIIGAVQQGKADIGVHVIEENPRLHPPRGWLSVKCLDASETQIHFFSKVSQLPSRFWERLKA